MDRPIRMLVADDSQLIQKLIVEAASATGLPLRVTATDNGNDCLTLLEGRDVDLAFIDVNMPDLSGLDAFWAARKIGVQTFVTLISSPPSTKAVQMGRRLRAYEFLFKPFKRGGVQAIVHTYARIKTPTKVLVVDDSHTVRQIIQKTIRHSIFACDITEAEDGKAAIRLCRNRSFDVVFLDCNMPGLSGLETLQRLIEIDPKIKVVMISSERDAAREVRARKYGAFAFLPKPFTAADMDLTLHDIHALRSPNLHLHNAETEFEVMIDGRTVRVVHADSGNVFEYVWFKDAPHLRNATVFPGPSNEANLGTMAAIAETAALQQLNSARLVSAA